MIILDENIDAAVRRQLLAWRIQFRQIGREVGRQGMPDQSIIKLLHKLDRPTFFTRDRDFNDPRLCHDSYCVVFLDVVESDVARTIRRLLAHSHFDTSAKRLGTILDVSADEIKGWCLPQRRLQRHNWPRS